MTLAAPPKIPLSDEMVEFATYLNRADNFIESDGIADLRAGTRALREATPREIPFVQRVDDLSFERSRYRIIRPIHKAQLPAAIYLHGGGWSHLDIDVYDPIVRRIALESGLALAAIDFPLVPDVQFPLNLDACVRFVRDIATKASATGTICLLGDSAGANLAIAVALVLRDAGENLVNSLGLIYGTFDLEHETESHAQHGDGSTPLTIEDIRKCRSLYIPGAARRCDPLVSPVRADLRGLPDTFLAVASHDPHYDESIALASKLGQSGCDVTLTVYAGAIHGFLEAESINGSRLARRALRDLGKWVRSHCH